MARDRFQPGVYQVNNPDTGSIKEISVDNQTVRIPPGASVMAIVYNQLFDKN